MSDDTSPKSLDFVTVDVFTKTRFEGNPLAIVNVPGNRSLGEQLQQKIAREFNLSETVFLYEEKDGSPDRKIDIFLPTRQIPLAGHPTIGVICYLCAGKGPVTDSVHKFTLHTKAGPIAASYDYGTKLATASLPHKVNVHKNFVHWKHILDAQPLLIQGQDDKGQRVLDAWNHRKDGSETSFPIVSIVDGMNFVLVDFPRLDDYLEKIRSDQPAIDPNVTRLDEGWSAAMIAPYYYVVLADEGDGIIRIRTRFIIEYIGEDSATGSGAAALASYLSLRKGEAGKTYTIKIEQGVEMGRSSKIEVEVALDDSGKSIKRVLLSGTAVAVMQGILTA